MTFVGEELLPNLGDSTQDFRAYVFLFVGLEGFEPPTGWLCTPIRIRTQVTNIEDRSKVIFG